MKILFVGSSASMMLHFRGEIIQALKKDGHEIAVLVPKEQGFDELQDLGIPVQSIPLYRTKKNIFCDITLFISLCFFYAKLKPKLIIHYAAKPNLYGSLAAKLFRIRSIAVISGLGYTFINTSFILTLIRSLFRFAVKQSSEIWFLNQSDAQEFFQNATVPTKKVQIIPGEGIDLRYFAPRDPPTNTPKIVFLMISRILVDKGIKEFIEAAIKVKAQYPHAVFQLLGDCDPLNPTAVTKQQVLKWQASRIIDYLGVAKDVRPYIAAADCIVLPSYREGLSRALLEGAAMAKPLLITDVPGCRELVIKNQTGWVCEVKDSNSLAAAYIECLNTPHDVRVEMGLAGRELIEQNYTTDRVLSCYQDAISRACHY